MTYFIVALIVFGELAAFFAGKKYGQTLESEAFAEVSKVRTACAKVGLKFETLVSGEVSKIKAELHTLINKL